MFGGILEKIRLFESDIEHHIDNIVQQKLLVNITNKRHQILRDHFIVQQAEAIRPIANKLLDLYLDEDDIINAQEAPSEGEDIINLALKEFEAQVAEIREYHRTFRDLPPIKSELDHPNPAKLDELFSLGERYGNCLDLETHYHNYSKFMSTTTKQAEDMKDSIGNNWKGRVEYFTFIPNLTNIILNDIDPHRKVYGFQLYRKFVEELLSYFIDFYSRIKIMEKDILNTSLEKCNTDAEEYWSKLLENKESITKSNNTDNNSNMDTNISVTDNSVTSTLTIPPPLRKYNKTFALWPITYIESLINNNSDNNKSTPSLADIKSVIYTEGKIVMLLRTLLFETLQETEKILLRDYSKTTEELEWERKHLYSEFINSLEEAKKKCSTTIEGSVAQAAQYDILNTLNSSDNSNEENNNNNNNTNINTDETSNQLLDRDGKPVARWLIQLQQLHKRFICEVCGGTVYIGPKAFKEHFGAERHAEGLRRLGVILHLKEYEGMSSIRKVIEMRDKILGNNNNNNNISNLRKRLREDQECEEMQDAQGNVITAGEYRRFQMSRRGN